MSKVYVVYSGSLEGGFETEGVCDIREKAEEMLMGLMTSGPGEWRKIEDTDEKISYQLFIQGRDAGSTIYFEEFNLNERKYP